MIPTVKGEKGVKIEEYREVTLTQTAYKVYAAVLAERLREKVKSKALLLPSQTGFRRRMETINNIYVLNHLIHKKVAEE